MSVAEHGTVSGGYLRDPFAEWLDRQKLPLVEDFGVDLMAVDTARWDQLGGRAEAAFVNLGGRGDYLTLCVEVLPPGAATTEQRHLYDEIVYVLAGRGSTTIVLPDGRKHSFEWGKGSLFALPLNVRYQHFNTSGREAARLACTVDLPFVVNFFRNEQFILNTDFAFAERFGQERHFTGQGDLVPAPLGRVMWETNFVPDLAAFDQLRPWAARGASSSNIIFVMAESSLHAHVSEMSVGTYKKAHKHGPDYHVFCVAGTGYSLFWYAGDQDFRRVDWRHGVVFAPGDQMFHQHFNTGPTPARYLATGFGTARYPITTSQHFAFRNVERSVADGGVQIEYKDQDPRIHRLFLEETAKTGAPVRMDGVGVRS